MNLKSIGLIMLLWLCCAFTGTIYAESADLCKNCIYAKSETSFNVSYTSVTAIKMAIVLLLVIIVTLYSWFSNRKKGYLALGIVAFLLILGSYIYSVQKYSKQNGSEVYNKPNCPMQSSTETANTTDFLPVGNEFENTATSDSSQSSVSKIDTSEMSASLDEFSAQTDSATETKESNPEQALLMQILVLLALSAIIGLTIKYAIVRHLRGLVLLSSVVYLGFVKGACPCMIMSFQTAILFVLGNPATLVAMLWFLGLLVVTYFFGKTWCGWLCHLGGLQELLYRATGKKMLTSVKSQTTIKYVQITLLFALIVQLTITHTNIWVKYDPFKVAYNLISANTTGYILVALLLVSSVFIYRPFCRIACPVGLILGWVTMIPGARKLKVSQSTCNACRSCTKQCKQHSLHSVASSIKVNTQDCILCGDCLGYCKKGSLIISNKK